MNKRYVTESAEPARIISIVIMVLGVIGSLIMAIVIGDWGLGIGIFVGGVFASFLQSFIFKLFAEVLEDLCAIRNELDEAKQKLNEK